MGWYDTAQICLNGHVINSCSIESPEDNNRFCQKCGLETIDKCPKCNASIRGSYFVENVFGIDHYTAPLFCNNCGDSYPWAKAKMQAARELAQEIDSLSKEEKTLLSQSIDDIVKDTPRTSLAVTRIKRFLSKSTGPVINIFRDLIIDIASETAKKTLKGEQ